MFGFIEQIFIRLLTSVVNVSSHAKCVSLSNQKCKIQPTLINLHVNEYTQELCYYPFAVSKVVILLMIYLIKYVFQIKQMI